MRVRLPPRPLYSINISPGQRACAIGSESHGPRMGHSALRRPPPATTPCIPLPHDMTLPVAAGDMCQTGPNSRGESERRRHEARLGTLRAQVPGYRLKGGGRRGEPVRHRAVGQSWGHRHHRVSSIAKNEEPALTAPPATGASSTTSSPSPSRRRCRHRRSLRRRLPLRHQREAAPGRAARNAQGPAAPRAPPHHLQRRDRGRSGHREKRRPHRRPRRVPLGGAAHPRLSAAVLRAPTLRHAHRRFYEVLEPFAATAVFHAGAPLTVAAWCLTHNSLARRCRISLLVRIPPKRRRHLGRGRPVDRPGAEHGVAAP
jgi:hypothetical protein